MYLRSLLLGVYWQTKWIHLNFGAETLSYRKRTECACERDKHRRRRRYGRFLFTSYIRTVCIPFFAVGRICFFAIWIRLLEERQRPTENNSRILVRFYRVFFLLRSSDTCCVYDSVVRWLFNKYYLSAWSSCIAAVVSFHRETHTLTDICVCMWWRLCVRLYAYVCVWRADSPHISRFT